MTEQTYAFNYPEVIKALDEDLKAQMDFLTLDPNAHQTATRYLAADLQSIRFNMLSDMLAVSDTWRVVRDSDTLVDLVLDLTTSIRFRTETIQEDGWNVLCRIVSEAIGCFNHGKVDSTYSTLDDNNERDRFVSDESAQGFIQSNPWLVTLFLLRRTETVRQFTRDLTAAGKRTVPTAGEPPKAS